MNTIHYVVTERADGTTETALFDGPFQIQFFSSDVSEEETDAFLYEANEMPNIDCLSDGDGNTQYVCW